MKKYSLKCPECGANLEIDEDREVYFCSFCGAKIEMNKLDKSELKIAEMEHAERMKDKQLESEKNDRRMMIVLMSAIVLIVAMLVLMVLTVKPDA